MLLSLLLVVAVSVFSINQAHASFLFVLVAIGLGLTGLAIADILLPCLSFNYFTFPLPNSIKTSDCEQVQQAVSQLGPQVNLNASSTVEFPNPISLSWQSVNVQSCEASGGWSGTKDPYGSEDISKPVGNYSFQLTCTDPTSGASASANANVTVASPSPQCTFTANPTTITVRQKTTLSWNCNYATSCSIDQGVGNVTPVSSGSVTVEPPSTTVYTLTCSNDYGSQQWTVGVNVNSPQPKGIREVAP